MVEVEEQKAINDSGEPSSEVDPKKIKVEEKPLDEVYDNANPDTMTQEELDDFTRRRNEREKQRAEDDPVEKERSDEMKSELR